MSNPNFLTANTQGIELMPGVNDNAVGYDVNRIVQALNGTNLVPITTGNLTVSGTLSVSGALSGPFTIDPGPLTIRGDFSVIGDSLQLTSKTASTKGGSIAFQDAGTNEWEIYHHSDQSLNLWDFTRGANILTFPPNGVPEWQVTAVKFDDGLNLGSGNTSIAAPNVHSDGASVYIEAASGSVRLRPTGTNNSTNEIWVDSTHGDWNFSQAVSRIIPGATSLSVRNHANSADNLLLTDAGLGTMRNALSIPPSSGGTVAPTSYGTIQIKIGEVAPTGTQARFSSIPSGFRHLVVEYQCRTNLAANLFEELQILFNSDSGTNYDYSRSGAAASTNQAGLKSFFASASTALANAAGIGRIFIPNYSGTTFYKAARTDWFYVGSSLASAEYNSGLWHNTAAINDVIINTVSGGSFLSGSIFTLYGIP